eukprot:6188814-Pleurochrysis_carterae.AAC.2
MKPSAAAFSRRMKTSRSNKQAHKTMLCLALGAVEGPRRAAIADALRRDDGEAGQRAVCGARFSQGVKDLLRSYCHPVSDETCVFLGLNIRGARLARRQMRRHRRNGQCFTIGRCVEANHK